MSSYQITGGVQYLPLLLDAGVLAFDDDDEEEAVEAAAGGGASRLEPTNLPVVVVGGVLAVGHVHLGFADLKELRCLAHVRRAQGHHLIYREIR
jgi:hypothetical protein